MNSCRALEKVMLSHSEPSSALRDELGSIQYQIAQEGVALWVTADMGFTAGKTFAQTLEGAADVSYLSAFKGVLDKAKAAQEAERVLHAQQQAAAAAAAAARQPRVSPLRGSGRPYGDTNAWWEPAWEYGTSGPTRKRGPKAGSPASGGKAAAPVAATCNIHCYKCGEVGHKSNVCTQTFTLEDPSGSWQPEVQQAIGWRADWVAPEDNQNARQAWSESNWQESAAKGTGRSGGKTGSKGKSGTKGFGGYGKGGGAASSDKGGGKGNGWATGGRGKGASWSWPWPGS